jgi:hypothetical protein
LCETRDTKLDAKTYEKQIYEITQGLNLVEKRLTYDEHENKEMANFFLRQLPQLLQNEIVETFNFALDGKCHR